LPLSQIFPPTLSWTPSPEGEAPKIRDLFTSANLQRFEVPWESKRDLAFFRGTATGGGVTTQTNQRLHIAQLCHEWETGVGHPHKGYLDGGVVGWNLRDKKISSSAMTFIRSRSFPFKLAQFTPIYEQSTYKYLLYVEGHCAACRYGFMMCLGSVILKVDSLCVADEMWYFPLLRPYVDHVPVKADLSDLAEKIEWCRQHDDQCREIARTARLLHDRYISREGILDYLQVTSPPPPSPPSSSHDTTDARDRDIEENGVSAGLLLQPSGETARADRPLLCREDDLLSGEWVR
jgi:hypothetical protein